MRNIRIECAACVLLAAGCIMPTYAATSQAQGDKTQTQDAADKTQAQDAANKTQTQHAASKTQTQDAANHTHAQDEANKTHAQGATSNAQTQDAANKTRAQQGAANKAKAPRVATKTHAQRATNKLHNPSAQASLSFAALGPKIGASVLANVRGGSDVKNRVKLNGSVSDTRTRNVVTGMNSVGGRAFGNAAGLSVVIQNSGNSVLIQNTTVVNLQLQQ